MSLREKTIEGFKRRRQRILDGSINTIPSPFKRFSGEFLGLEKALYIIVTSFTKGGKSQFVSNLLFDALMFCYNNPSTGITTKILWFPLEETEEKIMTRIHSWLLMKLYDIRISSSDLKSSDNNKPLSQEILNKMESEEFIKIINYFEEHIIFSNEQNPTGIYKVCKHYAKEHGIIHTKPAKYKDELGNLQETQAFDYYEENNPDEIVIPVIDTINLTQIERGLTKKQAIDKLSEYMIEMRNRYHQSPIIIQQQNTDNESIDSIKMNRTRPTTAGLGDSRYTSHDANLVLGIFSPFRFGIESYLPDESGVAYDIKKLKDHFRTLEVLANRDGEMGGIIGLLFDGATCSWTELPRPNDPTMNKVYNYVKSLK